MKKFLASLIFALCLPFAVPSTAHAQGFTLENFSGFTSGHTLSSCSGITGDCATLVNSWFGTGVNNSSSTIQNSAGALTIQSTSACAGGDPPNHSGKYLDYSTTLGSGVSDQIAYLYWPTSGVSAYSLGSGWFCSTVPASTAFGTTWDAMVIVSTGGPGISNYTSNGTSQCFDIEGDHAQPCVPYTSGTWVQVVWQFVSGTSCVNSNHSDCLRLQLYDKNGTFLGEQYASVPAPTPSYMTLGDINGPTLPSGYHVQFADIKICTTGCSVNQFPELEYPVPAWDGILTSGHGIDWTQAGFNGGQPPDAAWTQCGSTLAAGTYTGAAITSTLAGCGANTYYLLGAGTFNITGQVNYPPSGHIVVRGSGSRNTFVVGSSGVQCAGQISAVFCMDSSDHTYTTEPPPTIYNITAGYQQGANQETLSGTGSISTSTPTMLFIDQCDTGRSGASCTGSTTDNGNFYACGDQYTSSGPHGCSFDGVNSGGSRTERDQLEIHTATNIAGSTVTITPPLAAPNLASGQSPQVWIAQPLVLSGLENMSIDVSASSASLGCADAVNAYQIWITGVVCSNNKRTAINFFQVSNFLILNNYIFNSTGTLPSNYGIRLSATAYGRTCNNIIQSIQGGPIFYDGAATGDVDCYNFIPNSFTTFGGDLTPITEHAGDYFVLHEGNFTPSISCDNIHGTCDMSTRYRNFLPGWQSYPSSPISTYTIGIDDFAFARYAANVGQVLGTPGYHNTYTSSSSSSSIYNAGTGGGSTSVPTDSLTKSTTVYWASYDSVTGSRFCGNSLDTGWAGTCSSASEIPISASTYPSFVPVHGDTAAGEPALPASFVYSSRPAWWNVSIPFPAVGPDVTGGNVIQCGGSLNVPGNYNGSPALATSSNCPAGGTGWAGHVNAIPAMVAYFNAGGPPDGSGSILAVNLSYANSSVTLTSSVPFGTVTQNTTSPSMNATLTNNSGSTISSITITIPASTYSADFTITGTTCGASLVNGAACTVTLTSKPTATPSTLETATLQVTYTGASGSPLTSALSVTSGSPGSVTLSPSIVPFGLSPQNVASGTQIVTLANASGSTISSPTASYTSNWSTISTTCGATLTTGNSCTYTVGFTPTSAPGTIESGTMQVSYTGASGSPVSSTLSGTSGSPFVVQQHVSTNQATLAYNPNIVATHILVAHLTDYTKIATLSMTDTAGNSWNVVPGATENLATDGDSSAILCAVSLTSGPDTVTFLANGSGGDNFNAEIYEISGHTCTPDVASVVDNHTGATACGNGTLSITTATASDFLVQGCAIAGAGGSRIFTPGSGWANQTPNNGVGASSYTIGSVQAAASPGAFNAGGTFSPATEEATIVVAFKTSTPPVVPTPVTPCMTCFAGSGTWNGIVTKQYPVSVLVGNSTTPVPLGNVTVTANVICVCTVPNGSAAMTCSCTAN